MVSQLGPGIDVRTTFRDERDLLIQLLRKLDESDWAAETVCPGWSVRDVAVHLLHDDLRRLSRSRDHVGGPVPDAGESLPTFLNRANDRWVEETGFISPQLLVDLLAHTAPLLHRMWTGSNLDLLGEGVWWAGVEAAPVWLDVARDYSEDWIHLEISERDRAFVLLTCSPDPAPRGPGDLAYAPQIPSSDYETAGDLMGALPTAS
jgi:hypothetical protein